MNQCSQQIIRAALPERKPLAVARNDPATTNRKTTGLPILGERDTNFTEFSGSSKINRQRDGTHGTYQIVGR